MPSLVGSEMCIRDRPPTSYTMLSKDAAVASAVQTSTGSIDTKLLRSSMITKMYRKPPLGQTLRSLRATLAHIQVVKMRYFIRRGPVDRLTERTGNNVSRTRVGTGEDTAVQTHASEPPYLTRHKTLANARASQLHHDARGRACAHKSSSALADACQNPESIIHVYHCLLYTSPSPRD